MIFKKLKENLFSKKFYSFCLKRNQKTNGKKGVTLLLAILTMGLVMFIALAIAEYFLVEFRITQGIGNSIKAYYLAESGMEKGLYLIKNNTSMDVDYIFTDPNDPKATYTLKINEIENGFLIECLGNWGGIVRKLDIKKTSR